MIEQWLAHIGVFDVLDIVATSVLIYYTLLLIRGTRAVQILSGILVLVGLLALAKLLHLNLLGSILQLLVVGAAVTLPIVFQPELRRVLEQLGRGGLFRLDADDAGHPSRSADPSLAAACRSAFALSSLGLGGLMVIQQQSGLNDFAESGTPLDATISNELLIALFSHRSPLHDGATILCDDRILAAGCLLPLADQPRGERRYGTRHRAALGLSEQTDAVVIVISEESGAICVAREGKLSRPFENEGALLTYLLSATRRHAPERNSANDLWLHVRARLFPAKPPLDETTNADHPQELRT